MKKTIRKNQQISLINPKGAGRPRLHDPGICHIERPKLSKPSSLHLTIKVKSIKAEMKYYLFYKGEINLDHELLRLLDRGKVFFSGLDFVGTGYH
jgi:hypothetical protein